jgi:hypothetical protein
MKNIIKRNLPLDIQYNIIDKQYIPLIDGIGTCCSNCGKLIANIATVKNSNNDTFYVGFDCLETLLINNQLLSNNDIIEYQKTKKSIPKILRFIKTINQTILNNQTINITGLLFEKPTYSTDYITFYWLADNSLTSRNNDYVKLKDVDFDFFMSTLSIVTKLNIYIDNIKIVSKNMKKF